MKLYKQLKIWNRQRKAWMKVCHAASEMFPEAFFGVNGKAKNSAIAIITLLQELRNRREFDLREKARSISMQQHIKDFITPVGGPDYGPPPDTRSDAQRLMDYFGKGLGGSVKHIHQFLEGGANPVCDICKKTYAEIKGPPKIGLKW